MTLIHAIRILLFAAPSCIFSPAFAENSPALTTAQEHWLQGHRQIRRTADAGWPPFEFKNRAGEYVGICMDYFNLVAERLNLQVELVPDLSWTDALENIKLRNLDVITCLDQTAQREQYMVFTKPFTTIPQVVITRNDAPYISGLNDLRDKKIAMIKSYVTTGIMKQRFPSLEPVMVESSLEGLKSVAVGQADAFVGSLAVAVYLIQNAHLSNLKIAAPAEVPDLKLRFAFRKDWPQMAGIFNRVISTISPQERTQIQQRWVSVDIDPIVDYTLLWRVAAGFTVLLLLTFLWISQMQRQKKALLISESRFRSVIDNAIDGIIVANEMGVITNFSPAAEKIFGYTEAEALKLNVSVLLAEPFRSEYMTSLKNYLETGNAYILGKSREIEGCRKDNSIFPLDLSVSEIHVAGRRFFTGIARDITERKSAQNTLHEARNEAEAATRAKASFLANMSHEIRTPMNAIIGLTHLTLQTELSRKQHDYLTKTQNAANSLLGIINEILDFSKIEAGKLKIDQIDFKLEDVLSQLSDVVGIKAAEKGLEFLFSIEKDVPNGLIGDPLRLGQILINFCTNAVKFTEQGEVVVSISQENQGPDHACLHFSVRDTGIGITQEQHEKLFQSFSQADDSTTRKYGGTGLGLSISKQLVELMGGKIGVESVYGQGSNFYFTAEFGLQEENCQPILKPVVDSRGMRVLVVDDSESAREILSRTLASLSFNVTAVSSGETALTELDRAAHQLKTPYDVVLMDWKMPGLDGIEATRRIHELNDLEDMPTVIMVTAYDQEEVMEKAGEVHFDGILTKPVNPSVLFDAVMNVFSDETAEPSAPITSSMGPNQAEAAQKLEGCRILLVEDNEINRLVGRNILENAGLIVETADNGKIAVSMFERMDDGFSAVLMDLQMPEMDGYEATRTIRAKYKNSDIPIIAMTAHTMNEERQKCLQAGMNDHVAKPIDPEQLFAVLLKFISPIEGANASTNPSAGKSLPHSILPNRLPGFDLEQGLERIGRDEPLYFKLLHAFRSDHQQAAANIEKTLDQQDFDAARKMVHAIKGVSGNLSANRLFKAARDLEDALKQSKPKNPELKFAEFETALQEVLESLDTLNPQNPQETEKAADTHPVDTESIAETVKTLSTLLADFNMKAEDSFHTLQNQLQQEPYQDELIKLEQAINNLEFDTATTILNDLAVRLNIVL